MFGAWRQPAARRHLLQWRDIRARRRLQPLGRCESHRRALPAGRKEPGLALQSERLPGPVGLQRPGLRDPQRHAAARRASHAAGARRAV